MRVLLSGSRGLIGGALLARLNASGEHELVRLVRPGQSGRASGLEARPDGDRACGTELSWDPASGALETAALEDAGPFDAVVHLGGESIASGRWSPARKERIRSSRIESTRLLVSALAALHRPPKVFVTASAIGYYGDRGEEPLTEGSGPGHGFLAGLCVEWEKEAELARSTGTRVVTLRTGIVLSKNGGALAKQLPLFRLGLGGKLGSGRQYMSWITLRDEVAAIEHCMRDAAISGPVNLVAPNPATNAEFTAELSKALSRPAFFTVPAVALSVALGSEAASELVLASQRVVPERLVQEGFGFADPDLGSALAALLA